MKIGILTFHFAHNFGAMLQAYALQEYLKKLGHEVEIINYQPQYLKKIYKFESYDRFKSMSVLNKIRFLLTEPIAIYRKYLRYRKFQNFMFNNLNISHEIETEDDITNYDYIFFGSDQIWNPRITNNKFDPIYTGQFSSEASFIAYAPSMETTSLTEEEKNEYTKILKKFKCISVREKSLQKLLENLTLQKVELVCDPTFLLSQESWNKLSGKTPIEGGKYILVYQTRYSKKAIKIAKEIAKKKKCKIIQLRACFYWQYINGLKQIVSPVDFLNYIKFAEFVVTTSFHGTAFSIIFRKNFFTVALDDNKNDRSRSLLSTLDLSNRLISDKIPDSNIISYENTDNILNQYINHSKQYIKDSFQ